MASFVDKYIGQEIDLEHVTCLYEEDDYQVFFG